jgi:molybdate transport system regulatory protein
MSMAFSFYIRIPFTSDGAFFGPGVNELLHNIDVANSLSAAATMMGMSYSKGWKIIHAAEKKLGYPLTVKSIGGVRGGGSSLTGEGRSFMERYDAFVAESRRAVQGCFEHYFPEAQQ